MLRTAAGDAGRAYKQQLIDLLDITPGHTVLDAGCGPGTDLPSLADRVGEHGTVIGVAVIRPCSPAHVNAPLISPELRSGRAMRTRFPFVRGRWTGPRSTGF